MSFFDKDKNPADTAKDQDPLDELDGDLELQIEESQAELDLPYELLGYCGMDLYRCTLCAWDTTKGLEEFMEHYRGHFPPPAEPPPSSILLANKRGREVK